MSNGPEVWTREVDHMMTKLHQQFTAAKRAFGVKPDMDDVKKRIDEAGTTLFALGDLLAEMEQLGFSHPPDVLQWVREKYDALHTMAVEHKSLEDLVVVRSRWGHTEKFFLN